MVCVRLNVALAEVQTWLSLKRQHGKYAHCFLAELAVNSFDRSFHIYAVYDEIGKLEGADATPSITKKPRQMRAPLRGLWHKHYSQANSIVQNIIDETEKMQRDGRWDEMFFPHYGKYLHEFIPEISYRMTIEAYARRAQDYRITGDFIVYERQADGSNYYLTLGKHGEWNSIRARVDEYKIFGAVVDL